MSTVGNAPVRVVTSSWMPEVVLPQGTSAIFAHFASVPPGPRVASVSNTTVRVKPDVLQKTGDVIVGDSGSASQVAPKSEVKYTGGTAVAFNITVALVTATGDRPVTRSSGENTTSRRNSMAGCSGSVDYVGGVIMPTSNFDNARELIAAVGSDLADPTADEYEDNIVAGNNDKGTTGIQSPLPTQTTPPKAVTETPKDKNDTPPPARPTTSVNCKTWDGVNYDISMGKHFSLRNFTIGYPDTSRNRIVGCLYPNKLIDAFGLTKAERMCNLQALAENVLDPLYDKIGTFRINSGIRNENSSKGISQHCKGQAVDVQVPGWGYDRYWDMAAWIKDNLPYDQFIFEHSDATKLAWFHLSFNRAGNRPVGTPRKVCTMHRNKYIEGLKRYF